MAVKELKKILPKNFALSQLALKWILMHQEVTVVIPGAINSSQVKQNTDVSEKEIITDLMPEIKTIFEKYIKDDVDHRWL